MVTSSQREQDHRDADQEIDLPIAEARGDVAVAMRGEERDADAEEGKQREIREGRFQPQVVEHAAQGQVVGDPGHHDDRGSRPEGAVPAGPGREDLRLPAAGVARTGEEGRCRGH